MEKLEIKAGIQILKPASEVFDHIVDPENMKNYFISQSSGYMKAGEELNWKFAEFDIVFQVKVDKIEKDKFISFFWDGAMDGEQTLVEISLKAKGGSKTQVSVTEGSKINNDVGVIWLMRNTEGWANFLACLKAWMEYGIHLRNGAFDPADIPV